VLRLGPTAYPAPLARCYEPRHGWHIVHGTTREDHAFTRLIPPCSDGSLGVMRDAQPFTRWRTDIVKSDKAGEGAVKQAPRR
jgi:hypothetical protein